MKKLGILLAALLLLCFCASCGGENSGGSSTGSPDTSAAGGKDSGKKEAAEADEARLLEDLRSSEFFAGRPFAGEIRELTIDSRSTDAEAGTDHVTVSVKAETEWARRSAIYVLDYTLTDKVWTLQSVVHDYEAGESYEPLVGVEQTTAAEEYGSSEAVLVQHTEDLPGLHCSFTYESAEVYPFCTFTKQETLHYGYDTAQGYWKLQETTLDSQTADWSIQGLWVSVGSEGWLTSGWSLGITLEITEVGEDYLHIIVTHPGEGGIVYDGQVEFDALSGGEFRVENPYDSWESLEFSISEYGIRISGTGNRCDESMARSDLLPPVEIVVPAETEFTYTLNDGDQTAVIRSYKGEARNLQLPDHIEGYAVVGLDAGAFAYNDALELVILPDTLQFIGDEAFACCASLKTIELPEGLVEIGASAFEGCDELFSFTLPGSLQRLGAYVFRDTEFDSIVLPEGIKEIPEGAFSDSGLRSITCASDLISIGEHAFSDSPLTAFTVPGSVKVIGESAFEDCDYLENLMLEEGVEIIGDHAFFSLAIRELCLPDTVSEIGQNAFRYCYNLEKLQLSASLKTLPFCAFAECEALEVLVIPEGVETLGEYAFDSCEALNVIYLPASLQRIEEGVFYSCDRLTTVHYAGTKEDWETIQITSSSNSPLLEANMKYESIPD